MENKRYCPLIDLSCSRFSYLCCAYCPDPKDCTLKGKCDYYHSKKERCPGIERMTRNEVIWEVIFRSKREIETCRLR